MNFFGRLKEGMRSVVESAGELGTKARRAALAVTLGAAAFTAGTEAHAKDAKAPIADDNQAPQKDIRFGAGFATVTPPSGLQPPEVNTIGFGAYKSSRSISSQKNHGPSAHLTIPSSINIKNTTPPKQDVSNEDEKPFWWLTDDEDGKGIHEESAKDGQLAKTAKENQTRIDHQTSLAENGVKDDQLSSGEPPHEAIPDSPKPVVAFQTPPLLTNKPHVSEMTQNDGDLLSTLERNKEQPEPKPQLPKLTALPPKRKEDSEEDEDISENPPGENAWSDFDNAVDDIYDNDEDELDALSQGRRPCPPQTLTSSSPKNWTQFNLHDHVEGMPEGEARFLKLVDEMSKEIIASAREKAEKIGEIETLLEKLGSLQRENDALVKAMILGGHQEALIELPLMYVRCYEFQDIKADIMNLPPDDAILRLKVEFDFEIAREKDLQIIAEKITLTKKTKQSQEAQTQAIPTNVIKLKPKNNGVTPSNPDLEIMLRIVKKDLAISAELEDKMGSGGAKVLTFTSRLNSSAGNA